MKKLTLSGLIVSMTAVALLLGGCAGSYQARSVDLKPDTMLVNPDILQKGTGDEALFRYFNPAVDFKSYSKVIIDPVLVYKQAELDQDQLLNYQKLANNAFVYLNQELGTQLSVVTVSGPGTMRFQFAIVAADKSKPVMNLLSSVMPIGIGLSVVKYAATGKQSGVGEITAEMRVTDAVTGQLIGAALDRRIGGKAAEGIWDTWYNADAALQYWAKRSAYVICTQRGASGCVKP